jgi:pimeloyl-ACP methyl ester carboxylesterase
MPPVSCSVRCCGSEIHYVEWGSRNAPPVIMSHGLARTGRDFDDLAERCTVAANDGDIGAATAEGEDHAALRSGNGAVRRFLAG